MTRRKGEVTTGKNGVLSLLFVPHRDPLKTLTIPHYKGLFRLLAFAFVVLAVSGSIAFLMVQTDNRSMKMALEKENTGLRLALETENTGLRLALKTENTRYLDDMARLNTLITEQEFLLKDAQTAMTSYQTGTARSEKTLDNYKAEYEDMIVAYIDKNIKSVSVSRGEKENRSFKDDVTTLKSLLKTAESAALDENEKKSGLAKKTAKLDLYIKRMPSSWPTVPHARVASDFGRRLHPVFRYYKMHEGLDIGERKGDPIYAAGSGTVISAERRSGYGNLVEIDHGNGYVTRYGHCSILLVSAGQKVNQGDEIALMGATGTATGPHLHFEVRIAGKAVDPEMFLSY